MTEKILEHIFSAKQPNTVNKIFFLKRFSSIGNVVYRNKHSLSIAWLFALPAPDMHLWLLYKLMYKSSIKKNYNYTHILWGQRICGPDPLSIRD